MTWMMGERCACREFWIFVGFKVPTTFWTALQWGLRRKSCDSVDWLEEEGPGCLKVIEGLVLQWPLWPTHADDKWRDGKIWSQEHEQTFSDHPPYKRMSLFRFCLFSAPPLQMLAEHLGSVFLLILARDESCWTAVTHLWASRGMVDENSGSGFTLNEHNFEKPPKKWASSCSSQGLAFTSALQSCNLRNTAAFPKISRQISFILPSLDDKQGCSSTLG